MTGFEGKMQRLVDTAAGLCGVPTTLKVPPESHYLAATDTNVLILTVDWYGVCVYIGVAQVPAVEGASDERHSVPPRGL